jgi:hypothetical protein
MSDAIGLNKLAFERFSMRTDGEDERAEVEDRR